MITEEQYNEQVEKYDALHDAIQEFMNKLGHLQGWRGDQLKFKEVEDFTALTAVVSKTIDAVCETFEMNTYSRADVIKKELKERAEQIEAADSLAYAAGDVLDTYPNADAVYEAGEDLERLAVQYSSAIRKLENAPLFTGHESPIRYFEQTLLPFLLAEMKDEVE